MTTQTTQDPAENLAKVCKHYGVAVTGNQETDIQALAKRPEFQAAYAKTQDVAMALEEMSVVRTPGAQLDGWYVANDVLAWDANARGPNKGAVVRKPGTRVLGADGRTYEFPNATLPQGTPRMATVQIGPCTLVYDILRNTRRAEFPGTKTFKLASHNTPLPTIGFAGITKKLRQPVGDNKMLPQDSGDFPVMVCGTIGNADDDVEYFPAGKFDESLAVYLRDGEERLKINLDPDLRAQYGIRAGAEKTEILEQLRGQVVFGMGKIGQTYTVEVERLEHNGATGLAVVEGLLKYLEAQGCLRSGSNERGPTVNMTFAKKPGVTGIPVGKLTIVGLSGYRNNKGEQVYKVTAQSKVPSLRHVRSESSFTDNETGETSTRVSNPDGFVYFPAAQGKTPSRFAGLNVKTVNLQSFMGTTPNGIHA